MFDNIRLSDKLDKVILKEMIIDEIDKNNELTIRYII